MLLLAIGYPLGAIPSGYLAGRWLKGIDLRECGSGSTGATNVLRIVGKGPALVVFLIDVGKCALAVLLAKSVGLNRPLLMVLATGTSPSILVAVVAMVLVLLRHRSNIERLIAVTEPKIGQKAKG